MPKRDKLTQQQQRRVKQRRKAKIELDDSHLGELQVGIVISRFGEQVDIADDNHRRHRLFLRQHLGECVSGDQVKFRLDGQGQGVVESIEDRSTVLTRTTTYGGEKAVVANIDRIFVITAPFPAYSPVMLDRYLVAAKLASVDAVIVFNKVDLEALEEYDELESQRNLYSDLGYDVLALSCETQQGLATFENYLNSRKSILVGQSGVGKSSIINALIPSAETLVGEVSDNSRLGTHTTTTSKLHFFNSGYVIDSPGVREFNLDHISTTDIEQGFIEFAALDEPCKFRNCRHINEPGCAIARAVEEGKIHPQRLDNYRKILQSVE